MWLRAWKFVKEFESAQFTGPLCWMNVMVERNEAKRRDSIHKSHLFFFFFFFGSLFKKWFGFLAQMKSYLEPSLSPPFHSLLPIPHLK